MRSGDNTRISLIELIRQRNDNYKTGEEFIDILDDICIDFEYEPKKLYRRLQEEMDWWWKDEL